MTAKKTAPKKKGIKKVQFPFTMYGVTHDSDWTSEERVLFVSDSEIASYLEPDEPTRVGVYELVGTEIRTKVVMVDIGEDVA